MSHKTKAQRAIEEALEQERVFSELCAGYHDRLMSVLERVSARHPLCRIAVSERHFLVNIQNDEYVLSSTAPAFENHVAWSIISDLEFELDELDKRDAEEERKRQLRSEALSKLSQEEIDVLGIR